MANGVIDRLEHIKLTTDEEEVIAISDDGRQEAIESCNLSLIGKSLHANLTIKWQPKTHLEDLGGWMKGYKYWRLDRIFSSSNFNRNLIWSEFLEEVPGRLIIKSLCSKDGKRV